MQATVSVSRILTSLSNTSFSMLVSKSRKPSRILGLPSKYHRAAHVSSRNVTYRSLHQTGVNQGIRVVEVVRDSDSALSQTERPAPPLCQLQRADLGKRLVPVTQDDTLSALHEPSVLGKTSLCLAEIHHHRLHDQQSSQHCLLCQTVNAARSRGVASSSSVQRQQAPPFGPPSRCGRPARVCSRAFESPRASQSS